MSRQEELLLRTKIERSLEEISTNTFKLCTLFNTKRKESKVFSWEDFKARKVAINCTQENVRAFLRRCDEQGYHFNQGDSANLVSWFERISYLYDKEVCFIYNDNLVGGLCHSESSWFESEGFDIIEYKDIPFTKSLGDYSDKELIDELLKRHK